MNIWRRDHRDVHIHYFISCLYFNISKDVFFWPVRCTQSLRILETSIPLQLFCDEFVIGVMQNFVHVFLKKGAMAMTQKG